MTFRFLSLSAAALVLSSGAALAQEGDVTDLKPAGEIRFAFGGKEMAFVTSSSVYDTVRIGSGSISPVDPEATGPGAKQLLSLMATSSLEGGEMITLMIEYTADPGKDGVVTMVEYTNAEMTPPYWAAGAAGRKPVVVKFESFAFDGKSGAASGRFEGELCKTADWGAAPDPADCGAVTGSFATELYQGL